MRWLLVWFLLCAFTHADRVTLEGRIQATFADEAVSQASEQILKGKHAQKLANPRPMPDGTGGQFQFTVDEYVGPQGAGYTMNARIRQDSCPERLSGEPCVWRWFQHEGPERYRDRNEQQWVLESLPLP